MSLAARAAAALLLSTSAVSCRNAGEPPGQAASGKVKVQPMLKLERTETCWLLTNSLSAEQVKLSAQAPTFDFGSFKLGGATAGDGQWQDSVIDGRAAQVGRWVVAGERPAEIRAGRRLRVQHGPAAVKNRDANALAT